jgi:Fe-S cluster biogenesis protein NfuA|tara:strand:- start:830 stop:1327 length:498 start_codon:yes stop_codon:yes gene_type:complete
MTERQDAPPPAADTLEEAYRYQIEAAMAKEAQRIVTESHDPEEIARLEALSLVDLYERRDSNLVPALMARLGPVRAALDGHGGGLVVTRAAIEGLNSGSRALSLVLDLDGACVSCGAAPGTLKGIQDDLLMDSEIIAVQFSSAMLEWFDELQREFVLKHGGVIFV